MDKDKDGTLSMEELREGLKNNNVFELLRKDNTYEAENGLVNDEFELIIEALDADNDG
jgi:Ca2+-binding EF-hand superfamily protein